jgi:hypothetical protein
MSIEKKQKLQTALERAAKELTPGCEVSFDPMGMANCINLRVNDGKTGKILYTSPNGAYWTLSVIEDKSHEELRRLLLAWMNNKSSPEISN